MATDKEREAAYRREQTAEMAHRSKPAAWTAFAAAAIFSGKGVQDAAKIADQTLAAYDSRFVATPAGSSDEED